MTKIDASIALEMSESEAIEGAQRGENRSFELLYSLHKRRVYSICLRMIGNAGTAEDLTQDAFLLLYRKISTYQGESAFSTWLHRLTVNVVLMHLRKKGTFKEISLEETLEPNDEARRQEEIITQDSNLAGTIDRVVLEHAIACLPAGYRMVFVLHDIEGYEHGEIGEMLGCSSGNSKSQLHKARLKLRDYLRKARVERRMTTSANGAVELPDVMGAAARASDVLISCPTE